MRSVVLSTIETEYNALSELVKEIKFIFQLLNTMNMNNEMPITIYVENVGAIRLSNNRTQSVKCTHKNSLCERISRGRENPDQICEI